MKKEWMNPNLVVLGVEKTKEDGVDEAFIKWCPECKKFVSWCHHHIPATPIEPAIPTQS